MMMERELNQAGYLVVGAENGNDALEKIQAHPDISLMISDINMPWKDGLELLSEIRQMESLKALPVMMVTTESGQDVLAKAKELGIAGFLIKPVAAGMIVSAVTKLLA
jgi:CheY-like chemotaxis protein